MADGAGFRGGPAPKTPLLILALFFSLLLFPKPAGAQFEENSCVDCHMEMEDTYKEVAVDWEESVHAQAGVYCQDCHGGNPDDFDTAMDEDQGFKPKPEPHEIADLCAKCHSDPRKMRIYNLPSNQYELYRKSVHGKKVIDEKDGEAPTCVNCHGKHKILTTDDPESPAHRSNIMKTCAGCHSKKDIMEKRGIPYNQYELYKTSVHGVPFFERGDLGVPTCVNCHGNHGITKTGTMALKLACTQCHISQEEAYKKSVHWEIAQRTGKPLCIDCHGNHGIKKPDISKFTTPGDNNCRACHAENSVPMELAIKTEKFLETSTQKLETAKISLQTISGWSGSGFEISHLRKNVVKAEKFLDRMITSTHSLDIDALESDSQKVVNLAGFVTSEVDRMLKDIAMRKRGLVVTWIVFFLFSFAIWQRSKYLKRD